MAARRSRVIAVALGLAGAAAGCSLAFHPSDYEGPSRVAEASVEASLGPDTSADDRPEATEGGTDGGAEAGADAEAGVSPFCAGVDAAFCADFDEGSLLLGWTPPAHTSGMGTLVIDDAVSVSMPGSAHATMPDVSTLDGGVADLQFLQKDLSSPWRETTLDFDVHIASASGHGIVIASLTFNGRESVGASLAFGDDGNTLQLTGMQNAGPPSAWNYAGYAYTPSTWTHVTFDILPATSGGKVLVTIGGTEVLSWTGVSFASDPDANNLELQLGLDRYGNFTSAVDVHYDNVVLRLL